MKNMNEKKGYVTPLMEIFRLETAPVLTSASAVSGSGTASDIGYGGLGDDEYGD